MATTAQTYGLIPAYHPSGQSRATEYTIASTYTTAIYQGALVKLVTGGGIENGDGSTDAIGVFAGCNYVDPTGKPRFSPNWPGLSGCTNIRARVYDDKQNVFRVGVSANASGYTLAAIGDQVDLANNTAGNASMGRSTASVASAAVGAGTQAQLRVVGFVGGEPYDATTNPFPELLVQIAQHQYVADKAAI